MIVIVIGLPGTGKSYFASKLAKELNANYLNSDRIRKTKISNRTYSPEEKKRVYQYLLDEAQKCLSTDNHLVIDATFHEREKRKWFSEQLKSHHLPVFIEITAEESVIKSRLPQERPYSDADQSVHDKIKANWEAMEESHLTLQSTDNNIDHMIAKALKYLQSYDL